MKNIFLLSTKLYKKAVACLMLLFCLLILSCENQDLGKQKRENKNKINIVVTTGMIGDLLKNISGDHANTIQLISPGVDPHLFKPGRDDVYKIKNADMVFHNGLQLEGKMSEILTSSDIKSKTYAISELIQDYTVLKDNVNDNYEYDPHIWMNIKLWSDASIPVADILSDYFPEAKEEFHENALRYKKSLKKLHDTVGKCISDIPEGRKILVTSHDSFQYFGEAYGISVFGIQGLSTESEASLKKINDLVDFINDKQIPAIFTESSVSSKSALAVIEGVKSQGHDLELGGVLYTDSTGPENSPEETYYGMMKYNVNTIKKGLTGSDCGN